MPNLQNEFATALIQYTSGSTGDPKGVVLIDANLLANIRAIGRAVEATSADVFVSWLPLYHDMGSDRRVAGLPLLWGTPLRHVAAELSCAPAKLVVGDPSLSRDAFRCA